MESIRILGARIDAIGREDALARIVALAHGDSPSALVVTIGTEMVMSARRDTAFRAAIAGAALSLCDTIGLLLVSRLRGGPLRERVTGVELVDDLAARSARDGLRLYFIGSRDDVALTAAARLRERYPNAVIAGARNGYFSPEQSEAIAVDIRLSGANVLLAGLGSPKQELWLERWLPATGARVGIGVGGSFDVVAGVVARAPERWQRMGLEWLYRLVREPNRWRRQLALPHFAILALAETLGGVLETRRRRV